MTHKYNKVYIGDNSIAFKTSIGQFAKEYTQDCTSDNIFLSIDTVSTKILTQLCTEANEVIFCPPVKWSSDDLKLYTTGWIEYLSTFREVKELRRNYYGLGPIKYTNKNFDLADFLKPDDIRKTEGKQIWIIGCSFSNGHGLENKEQRFGQLFADYFGLPVTFLTMNGASNQWCANQILQSDIREGDIVFWGITGVARSTLYTEDRQWPITINMLDKTKWMYKHLIIDNKKIAPMRRMITEEFLLSSHSLYETINHIEQVKNFLNITKCNYLIGYFADIDFPYIHHMGQMMHYIVQKNDNKLFVIRPEYPWADLITRSVRDDADDDAPVHHPGPKQHKIYADDLINKYTHLYMA